MVAPFSLERISSGPRRRLKPRALGRPQVRFERRLRRRSSTSEVFARRRSRPFAIQKSTRIALSEYFSASSILMDEFHKVPAEISTSSACRNLLTIKASCLEMLSLITGIVSARFSRMSSSRKLCRLDSVPV